MFYFTCNHGLVVVILNILYYVDQNTKVQNHLGYGVCNEKYSFSKFSARRVRSSASTVDPP